MTAVPVAGFAAVVALGSLVVAVAWFVVVVVRVRVIEALVAMAPVVA